MVNPDSVELAVSLSFTHPWEPDCVFDVEFRTDSSGFSIWQREGLENAGDEEADDTSLEFIQCGRSSEPLTWRGVARRLRDYHIAGPFGIELSRYVAVSSDFPEWTDELLAVAWNRDEDHVPRYIEWMLRCSDDAIESLSTLVGSLSDPEVFDRFRRLTDDMADGTELQATIKDLPWAIGLSFEEVEEAFLARRLAIGSLESADQRPYSVSEVSDLIDFGAVESVDDLRRLGSAVDDFIDYRSNLAVIGLIHETYAQVAHSVGFESEHSRADLYQRVAELAHLAVEARAERNRHQREQMIRNGLADAGDPLLWDQDTFENWLSVGVPIPKEICEAALLQWSSLPSKPIHPNPPDGSDPCVAGLECIASALDPDQIRSWINTAPNAADAIQRWLRDRAEFIAAASAEANKGMAWERYRTNDPTLEATRRRLSQLHAQLSQVRDMTRLFLSGFGCEKCLGSDATASLEYLESHSIRIRPLISKRRFDVDLMRCRACDQMFARLEMELQYWDEEGGESTYWDYLPLMEEELGQLAVDDSNQIERILTRLSHGRQRIQVNWPRNADERRASFRSDHLFIHYD